MKFKRIVISSIFWRGMYFATVLLLNVLLSRVFKAQGTGWIYYLTNYLSFILLAASLCLESGFTFFASKQQIKKSKLATLALAWVTGISLLLLPLFYFYFPFDQQIFSRTQFVIYGFAYLAGILLTTYFSALFYAALNYAVPNIILSITNLLLILLLVLAFFLRQDALIMEYFLLVYFLNYLIQGGIICFAYLNKNKLFNKWQWPQSRELTLLLRYSFATLFTNLLFFLLYRIDYWFVKNICLTCATGDLGNYIQVSKLAQLFLLLPAIIASVIFPQTASGNNEEVQRLLPLLCRMQFLFYAGILLLLAITGKWLFPWVFGNSFNSMFYPFICLIPGILSLSFLSLLSAYNAGKNKVRHNVKAGMAGLLVIVIGDCIFIPRFGILAAALVSSVGYLVSFLFLFYLHNRTYHIGIWEFFIPKKWDLRLVKSIFKNKVAVQNK